MRHVSSNSRFGSALAVASIAIAMAASSCVVGSPPGFGSGDVWTIPLVGPLDDDVLLVPVSINDTGPYLFLIDPDSRTSSLDGNLVAKLDLYTQAGAEETTEGDFKVPTFYSEVPKMEAGNLTVTRHKWRVIKPGSYFVGGREVRGVLGGDIIADSLMLQVDRDAGVVVIAEQGKISPPAGATKIKFSHFYRRRLAKVTVNGNKTFKMHLDLGGRLTRLWEPLLGEANLPKIPVRTELVDEYGTVQKVSKAGIAAKISVGGEEVQGISVVPFGDKRLDPHDIDGSLGQDFFARFHVTANWHEKSMWLSRRDEDLHATAAARITRWSSLLSGCNNPGCVSVKIAPSSAPGGFTPRASAPQPTVHRDPSLIADPAVPVQEPEQPAPAAGAPAPVPVDPNAPVAPPTEPTAPAVQPEPPVGKAPVPPIQQAPRFRVERDSAGSELARKQTIEVLLDAVDDTGKSMGLPKIQVTLREGADLVEGQLDTNYAGAANLVILDLSPLGRPCNAGERCYWVKMKGL